MTLFPAHALRISIFQLGITLSILSAGVASAQESTVSYDADYFRQWNPVTVADMIDRIPGISIALSDNNGGSQNQNNRGLGNSESILINGRRLSGKDNEARDQLDRISFEQVSHIEIIRGTSSDLLGVRNEGQIINIVTATDSEMSLTVAGNINRYQDGHTEPGGSLVLNGNRGNVDYRLSLEQRSRYQVVDTIEESVYGIGDFSPNDLRQLREITEQVDTVFNSNLSYSLMPRQNFSLNLLYEESDPPKSTDRVILDYDFQPPAVFREREELAATRSSWEIGADYTLSFDDNSQLNILSINNQRDQDTLRERYRVTEESSLQDLSLRNDTVNTERIYRAVYSRPLGVGHDLELGAERAQTILDTDLGLARLGPGGELVAIPVPNARSQIEEMRYEGFAVHHWQMNPRMKLETTLLYEVSEITQTGDIDRSRDFDFVRPKLDYRFDITPGLQLQLSVEKFVAQLSFADFAANTDPRDTDRDTVAGNPELRQQQSWRYTANLEYRYLDGRGVLNARAWHWEVSDAIGRIDVSEPGGPLESAAGNIGDGEVSALQVNSSFRVTPNLLLSGTVMARSSQVIDPFANIARRLVPNDRGFHSFNIRHDLPRWSLNYGIDYFGAPQGNRPLFDINRVDHLDNREDLSIFVERSSIGSLGLVARFEVGNMLDRGLCSDRFRYDGILATGQIAEVERRCSERGSFYKFELRGTF